MERVRISDVLPTSTDATGYAKLFCAARYLRESVLHGRHFASWNALPRPRGVPALFFFVKYGAYCICNIYNPGTGLRLVMSVQFRHVSPLSATARGKTLKAYPQQYIGGEKTSGTGRFNAQRVADKFTAERRGSVQTEYRF